MLMIMNAAAMQISADDQSMLFYLNMEMISITKVIYNVYRQPSSSCPKKKAD